jgi:hypothetical protein
MTRIALLVFASSLLISVLSTPAAASKFDLKEQAESYRLHYGLRDSHTKLVNYEGKGYEPLYGTRNFRVVLNGVYYRGGANNTYNRDSKRSNMNPLQKNGLTNLCREGFSEAVYLYATNFKSAPKTVTCRTRTGETNTLRYSQINGLLGNTEHQQLQKIYDHIKGKVSGPIYDHCWNGWHASGYVAAMALRQFCGYSAKQADEYWVRNTDGNWAAESKVRVMLRKFKPFGDLQISAPEKALICPN